MREKDWPVRTVLNDPLQSGRVVPKNIMLKQEADVEMWRTVTDNLLSYLRTPDGYKGIGKP